MKTAARQCQDVAQQIQARAGTLADVLQGVGANLPEGVLNRLYAELELISDALDRATEKAALECDPLLLVHA